MHPALQPLSDTVTKTRGTMASAAALIAGFAARLQAGIDAALADGVTPDALVELTDLKTGLDTSETELATAVAANP